MKNRQTFINKQLEQRLVVHYDGHTYNALRVDGDGYKTKLTLSREECIKFIERLENHNQWEKQYGC